MRFGSVCSGIEAASVAWRPLGWEAAWVSEIEPFPCAVLAHHYPAVPNLGDMTTLPARILAGEVEAPDLFCGGTPCQAFSVAGLRRSLVDDRGNLSLKFCEIANAIDTIRSVRGEPPVIIFWENVPGILNTRDNAFGCFLAGLVGDSEPLQAAGDRWTDAGVVLGPTRAVAWRILDAQYFGLAQRRRRVFVVASARDDIDPAQILFEWEGLRRDTAPSREAWKVASTIPARSTGSGGLGTDFDIDGGVIAMAHGQGGAEIGFDRGPTLTCNHEAPIVTHSLRDEGFDASEDGTGRGTPLVPVGFNARQDPDSWINRTGPLDTDGSTQAVAMINMQGSKGNAVAQADGPSFTLNAMHGHDVHAILAPTLAASNDPSRSPQSAEITAQVAAAHEAMLLLGGVDCENNLHGLNDPTGPLLKGSPTGGGRPLPAIVIRTANTSAIGRKPEAGPQFGETLEDIAYTQNCVDVHGVMTPAMRVRRLTPVECERLMGFPDGYTAIPWRKKAASECPDGPRYKALGNSWAVPVVRWIGQRINTYKEQQ